MADVRMRVVSLWVCPYTLQQRCPGSVCSLLRVHCLTGHQRPSNLELREHVTSATKRHGQTHPHNAQIGVQTTHCPDTQRVAYIAPLRGTELQSVFVTVAFSAPCRAGAGVPRRDHCRVIQSNPIPATVANQRQQWRPAAREFASWCGSDLFSRRKLLPRRSLVHVCLWSPVRWAHRALRRPRCC